MSRNFAALLLLFFTNPFIANETMHWWEGNPVEYDDITKTYDYAVVLSGITDPLKKPTDRIHFNKGADRIVHGVQLYKLGKASKLVISGGSGSLAYSKRKEGDQLKEFALLMNVPETDIILENQSRNTAENAKFTKNLIGSNASVIIVTSAFHMRRASGCFEKIGLHTDDFPTDLYTTQSIYTPDALIVPQIGAMAIWNILIKEWVGILAYRINGYI